MILWETAFAQTESEEATSTSILDFFGIFGLWFVAFLVFVASFFVASLVSKIIVNRIIARAKYEIHEEVIILIERSIYFAIVLVGAIISFNIVGIDFSSILGFLTIGIGFAFKDLLANFIAGVVILTQKKFKIGDLIKTQDRIGKIVEIDVRTTQVKSIDGTQLIIPNADMLTNVVQNFSSNPFRRISMEVHVHLDTPLDQSIEVARAAVAKVSNVVKDPETQILAKEFSDSSILLEVRFWIESTKNWCQVLSEVIQAVRKDFSEKSIKIPYPIRTIDFEDKEVKNRSIQAAKSQGATVVIPPETVKK